MKENDLAKIQAVVQHEPEELRMRSVGDDVRIVALRAREDGGTWRVVAGHVSAVSTSDSP